MQIKQTHIEFSEQLIKGKIAEMIFSQMFRDGNKFTVIPFGYESTFPEIAQYEYMAQDRQVFETIRNAPDFALVSHNKKEVYLVEVKYRHVMNEKNIKEVSEKIQNRWKSVRLFVATPNGFFMGNCADVIENGGKVDPLTFDWVNEKTQKEYTRVLNEFIYKPNSASSPN